MQCSFFLSSDLKGSWLFRITTCSDKNLQLIDPLWLELSEHWLITYIIAMSGALRKFLLKGEDLAEMCPLPFFFFFSLFWLETQYNTGGKPEVPSIICEGWLNKRLNPTQSLWATVPVLGSLSLNCLMCWTNTQTKPFLCAHDF